jgi:3-oxoacyl-[acyl-carrier protein] reductase
MDTGLTGKRALITGSSAGLGKAIAEMLAAEGTTDSVGRSSPTTSGHISTRSTWFPESA